MQGREILESMNMNLRLNYKCTTVIFCRKKTKYLYLQFYNCSFTIAVTIAGLHPQLQVLTAKLMLCLNPS